MGLLRHRADSTHVDQDSFTSTCCVRADRPASLSPRPGVRSTSASPKSGSCATSAWNPGGLVVVNVVVRRGNTGTSTFAEGAPSYARLLRRKSSRRCTSRQAHPCRTARSSFTRQSRSALLVSLLLVHCSLDTMSSHSNSPTRRLPNASTPFARRPDSWKPAYGSVRQEPDLQLASTGATPDPGRRLRRGRTESGGFGKTA